jgi:hypothetical protein
MKQVARTQDATVKQVHRCTSLAVARHAAKYSCAQQSNKSLDCRHLPCNRRITTALKRNKCLLLRLFHQNIR